MILLITVDDDDERTRHNIMHICQPEIIKTTTTITATKTLPNNLMAVNAQGKYMYHIFNIITHMCGCASACVCVCRKEIMYVQPRRCALCTQCMDDTYSASPTLRTQLSHQTFSLTMASIIFPQKRVPVTVHIWQTFIGYLLFLVFGFWISLCSASF